MSTRDEDILDFDFFDEEDAPSWEEPEGFEPVPPSDRGRRGRGSRFGPPRNLTPLLRLIGLIALAILVVVLLVVWVEGCTAEAKRDRNSTYLAEIGAIGNASARLGQQLSTLLTTPGLNQEDLDAKLGGYVQTAEKQMQRAEDLNPPGAMVGPNTGAVESLRYRANGLRGLQTAFRETVGRDRREHRRRTAPRADAAPARERHHLDGLVPGACRNGAAGGGDRGARRALLGVRHGRGLREPGRPRRDLAGASRARRRTARRRASMATGSSTSERSRAGRTCRRRPRRRSTSPTSSRSRSGSPTRVSTRKCASRSRSRSRSSPSRS